MAQICISNVSECSGCMSCENEGFYRLSCDKCGEGIYEGDGYYDFGDVNCDDCAQSYRKIA